jgi:hypothetical protein
VRGGSPIFSEKLRVFPAPGVRPLELPRVPVMAPVRA